MRCSCSPNGMNFVISILPRYSVECTSRRGRLTDATSLTWPSCVAWVFTFIALESRSQSEANRESPACTSFTCPPARSLNLGDHPEARPVRIHVNGVLERIGSSHDSPAEGQSCIQMIKGGVRFGCVTRGQEGRFCRGLKSRSSAVISKFDRFARAQRGLGQWRQWVPEF